MSFDKVETSVDFAKSENRIQAYWDKIGAFERLREKNRGKPKWSFLDGPITANNPMGVHHAWGRAYKDIYQRYFAMTGHELRYQNGFDCQGLWVEVEVEKELGLKSKQDIEGLVAGDRFKSIDKFVSLCKRRVDRFAKVQTEQSIRLGFWMDWDREEDWKKCPGERRSYYTMSDENNYTIWSFLKRCHGRDLVYRAYDSMPWCPRCAVGISQMEMHEGYKLVADQAVFVKFPLREKKGEFLLVWTTTPWTLPSNVGAAVHPDLTYVKVKFQNEFYYMAKGALTAKRQEENFKRGDWVKGVPPLKPIAQIFKERGGSEVVAELKGSEMVGWTYDGPFDDFAAQGNPYGYSEGIAQVVKDQKWAPEICAKDAHRIIPWEVVGETEGSGIVHIAPGCGREDFELGKKEGLPPVAPLNEEGLFLKGFGFLEGEPAYSEKTAEKILSELKSRNLLVAVEKYPHSYPHCWRCKTKLLFRLVDEWYISMSWREEIMKVCEDIRWIPDFGKQRELDWLKNMGDWMISKKRYWGLALPIWVCGSCNHFDVIGGREELKERATEGWDQFEGHSPHRPWIDLVKVACSKCGGESQRISDVGNPWLDAGIVPYSTVKYNEDRKYWDDWFPADFVTESFPGQFRNWFYALLAMSTMMEKKAPFKVLLGYALMRDEKGEEMHKSKGNSIPFEEAAEKISSDLMRWMFARHNPVHNINFGYKPAADVRNKFLLKLWNTYAFFCNYARLDKFDPKAGPVPLEKRPDIDRWILSDLQLLVTTANSALQDFDVAKFCTQAEAFIDDRLSNWYVRRNRRRFWKSEQSDDKLSAYQTLYTVLTTFTKLVAPIMPFLSEVMYQNLVGHDAKDSSVHWESYPELEEAFVDKELSAEMEALLRVISMGLSARSALKIKTRQPLAELKVQPGTIEEEQAVKRFSDQIEEELNIKKVVLHKAEDGPLVKYQVKPNFAVLGKKLGAKMKVFQKVLAEQSVETLVSEIQSGNAMEMVVEEETFKIEPTDLNLTAEGESGWGAITDRGTIVCLDGNLTEDLRREGYARELVRHIQNLRKESNLELEDRISLFLDTSEAPLQKALSEHKQYLSSETLTESWVTAAISDPQGSKQVKVGGMAVTIQLQKV